jgi:hypothetical protein
MCSRFASNCLLINYIYNYIYIMAAAAHRFPGRDGVTALLYYREFSILPNEVHRSATKPYEAQKVAKNSSPQ